MTKDNSSSVPESLLHWPYATRQLLQTPHPELIESHARNLLSRALNIGRLTAFVGSGASMAYGRISWIDMLYTAQTTVLRRYEAQEKDPAKESKHLQRLSKLLDKHKIERDSKANASAQLTVFQLSEELDKAIDEAETALEHRPVRTFRETIMWVTRDERGHAEQLLKDAFLDRDVDGHRITFAELNNGPFKDIVEASLNDERKKKRPEECDPLDNATIEKIVPRTLWGSNNPPLNDRYLPRLQDSQKKDLKIDLLRIVGSKAENIVIDFEKFLRSPFARYHLAARLRSLCELKRFKVLEVMAQIIDKRSARAV